MAIAPSVRGLILCEAADVDTTTRNITLRECFRDLRADRFPAETKPFFVFAQLVNGFGEISLRTDIVRLSDDSPVYRFVNRFRFMDRLQELRLKIEIGQFVAPTGGKYGIELWANDELIAMSDFTVIGENS